MLKSFLRRLHMAFLRRNTGTFKEHHDEEKRQVSQRLEEQEQRLVLLEAQFRLIRHDTNGEEQEKKGSKT